MLPTSASFRDEDRVHGVSHDSVTLEDVAEQTGIGALHSLVLDFDRDGELVGRGSIATSFGWDQPNTTAAASPLTALSSAMSQSCFLWSQRQSPCVSALAQRSTMATSDAHFGSRCCSGSCASTR